MFRIGESIETENRSVAARGWREEEQGMTANGHKVSFYGDENPMELVVMVV